MYLQFSGQSHQYLDYAHPFTIWRKRGPLLGIEDMERMKIDFHNPDVPTSLDGEENVPAIPIFTLQYESYDDFVPLIDE